MILFLSFIIIALIIVMARLSNLKRIPRKRKTKIKNDRLLQRERFSQHNSNNNNNKKPISEELIKACNDILVQNNNKCNCFTDDSYEFPEKDIFNCISKNNNSKCSKYNKCKVLFNSFMTGSEPEYNPDSWSNPIIEGSHNCYAYFLNDHIPRTKKKCEKICKRNNSCHKKHKECGNLKPQPGKLAAEKTNFKTNRKYTCKDMSDKVIRDNTDFETGKPVVVTTKFSEKCPHNHYKGALVVDPNNTYHFYRQDSNGQWSHKQGTLRVENKDASGKPIYAVHYADTNYNKKKKKNGINYTDFCNYFCLPKNGYLDTNAI